MNLEITPLALKTKTDSFVRSCSLRRTSHGQIQSESVLWFETNAFPVPPDSECDAFLLAVLMDAMREGRAIRVNGSVSRELLGNLTEYQAAWAKWLPEQFRQVDISVEHARPACGKVEGAVCAFSGGVDSVFSIWRHSQSLVGYRSQKVNVGAIVHGFDIPLEAEAEFLRAKERAEHTLADIGVGTLWVRTNYRQVTGVDWGYAFMSALVAALNNLRLQAGSCIVATGEPYDCIVVPWGSNPITDHLLSSSEFSVIHDGASHSRNEKVKEIAAWKMGTENLRVCWQGEAKDRNCGSCEKCLRTKLNFLAIGSPIPSCLPETDILQGLSKVHFGK